MSTHNLLLSRNTKNIRILSETFQFLVVKFSIYLNRRVFVMCQYQSQGVIYIVYPLNKSPDMVRVMLRMTGKIMTKSFVITY